MLTAVRASADGFDCEALAISDHRADGQAYTQPMFWLCRYRADDIQAATAWLVDRMEMFSLLLDGPAANTAARWLGDQRLWAGALAALRAGRRVNVGDVDSFGVRYELAVNPLARTSPADFGIFPKGAAA
ncbi:hypothetical protein [Streptomyces sp. NRRL WC-3742]|uniref:hypothetical protein n=1 Tax=Streptomyces sp. NRRL WC-3742 TaxID=1463934 RepID=UPI0004CA33DC|nr:hypothetical protein [Streptomyces sp. NRRL WC-3742]